MKELFKKKLLLETYIPIAIVVGALVSLLTGVSLIVAFGVGILLVVIGKFVYIKKKQSAL